MIRDDVPDAIASRLDRLVADEPPLSSRDGMPRHLHEYLDCLGVGSNGPHHFGLLWMFPARLTTGLDAHLVWSDTDEGDALLGRFDRALPPGLLEKGFRGPGDLWAPWCVAVVGDEVASIAQTVRKGPDGAEVGLDTAVGFRGRGLGAAATAGWSQHPALDRRTLFYGTGRANTSSRRVAQRLSLGFLGSTFAIP